MTHQSADLIVVGLGAVGSAALYQSARRGARVMGIDRFIPPHDRGSSHGESRITRLAIGEGVEYVPFAIRSHEIWRELEAETGQSLLVTNGGLVIGRRTDAGIHGRSDFIGHTIAAAKQFHIPHEVLTPDEVTRRFPPFRFAGDETCYYEPGAGFVRPEACVSVQIERARAMGARVVTGETVMRFEGDAGSASVITRAGTYRAERVIVTAGAWIPQLVGGVFSAMLRVYQQTLFWFAPTDAASFAPSRFPVFIWRHGASEDEHFYGFPMVGAGVKLATERFRHTSQPDDARAVPSQTDGSTMFEQHVRGRLSGISDRVLSAVTCLYTVSPDFGFVIDRHPEFERVLVASPCSGHGFKHSAAIGEALAEQSLTGASRLDISSWRQARVRRSV